MPPEPQNSICGGFSLLALSRLCTTLPGSLSCLIMIPSHLAPSDSLARLLIYLFIYYLSTPANM